MDVDAANGRIHIRRAIMRPRTFFLAAIVSIVALGTPRLTQAQNAWGYGAHSDNPNGPTVSPYLNLLNTNSQGFNSYQTLVKPIVDQQAALQRQGSALQQLQQKVNSPGSSAGSGRATGHQTYFMNYGHFYPNTRRR
jgi:hypothetical protein